MTFIGFMMIILALVGIAGLALNKSLLTQASCPQMTRVTGQEFEVVPLRVAIPADFVPPKKIGFETNRGDTLMAKVVGIDRRRGEFLLSRKGGATFRRPVLIPIAA